jgi:hypothetical protein
MSAPKNTRSGRHADSSVSAGFSTRTKVVWSSLALSMAMGAGVLMLGGGTLQARDATPIMRLTTSPASLESIFETETALDAQRWQAIVIYHSGEFSGSARTIGDAHRTLGLRGLGYHFVIGNGVGSADGGLEVGYRWMEQSTGAHATGPYADWYDRHAIGICLVGDGQRRQFSDRQMAQLLQLVRAIQRECGIPAGNVKLHSDIAPTEAPGWYFPEAAFREQLARDL